jgi:hypothetical protein
MSLRRAVETAATRAKSAVADSENKDAIITRFGMKRVAWRLKTSATLSRAIAATGAKPGWCTGRSATLSRCVAESPGFFLVRDGGLCSCSRGFNRQTLLTPFC